MNLLEKIRLKAQNPAAEGPVKIAFLGDSVTHGCFELFHKGNGLFDCVYDQQAVYHTRLKKKIETVFPNCPVTVINAGISGGTAMQGAERLQRDVIDSRPDLTVVCFGLNDVLQSAGLDGYLEGLQSVFSQLERAEIPCMFMTPNMMCTYVCPQLEDEWLRNTAADCSQAQNSGKLEGFLREAVKLCRESRVTVCDCYSDWKQLQGLNADVTYLLANSINHPTREMHALFADRLFETLFFRDIPVL